MKAMEAKENQHQNSGVMIQSDQTIRIFRVNENLWTCRHCKMVFEDMTNFKSHLFSEHGINGSGLYECSTCGKTFASKSVLQNHVIRVHCGLKPVKNYKCSHCHLAFEQHGRLQRHVKTVHYGIRDHQCDYCHMAFKANNKLHEHIKVVHYGIRYHCIHCEGTYVDRWKLKTHLISIHKMCDPKLSEILDQSDDIVKGIFDKRKGEFDSEGAKKKQAQVIEDNLLKNKFSIKKELRVVLRRLSRTLHFKKIVNCPRCHKSVHRGSLQRHIKMVHLGMRHQCKLCETRFKQSCDLKMHLKTEHGLDHYNASKVCQKSVEQVNEEFKAKNADNYLPNDIPDQHFDSVQDGETFT